MLNNIYAEQEGIKKAVLPGSSYVNKKFGIIFARTKHVGQLMETESELKY